MPENLPAHLSVETLTLDERTELFFAAVSRHSKKETSPPNHSDQSIGLSYGPPNGDQTIRAQAASMIEDRDLVEPVIRDGFNMREAVDNQLTAIMYPNLVYRAEWKAVRQIDPEGWRRGDYLDETAWIKVRRKFIPQSDDLGWFADGFYNDIYNNFLLDIGIRNVGSNPAEREIPIHLLMRAFPELFRDGSSVLEIGSGPMHILKVLAAGMKIGKIAVIKQSSPDWDETDPEITSSANQQLSFPVSLGASTGIDLVDFNLDTVWRKWPEECTIRPADETAPPKEIVINPEGQTEMMTPRQLYEYIEQLKLENVEFMRADLNDKSDAQTLRARSRNRGIKGYDIIYYPTVLQQQQEYKRQELMKAGKKQGKKGSWEIVQDFAWPNPEEPKELIFAKDIYEREGSYSLNVKDKNGDWQQMLVMQNDRCQRLKLGLGVLSVGRKKLSMADRLK